MACAWAGEPARAATKHALARAKVGKNLRETDMRVSSNGRWQRKSAGDHCSDLGGYLRRSRFAGRMRPAGGGIRLPNGEAVAYTVKSSCLATRREKMRPNHAGRRFLLPRSAPSARLSPRAGAQSAGICKTPA